MSLVTIHYNCALFLLRMHSYQREKVSCLNVVNFGIYLLLEEKKRTPMYS